jgi:hypothetical protein
MRWYFLYWCLVYVKESINANDVVLSSVWTIIKIFQVMSAFCLQNAAGTNSQVQRMGLWEWQSMGSWLNFATEWKFKVLSMMKIWIESFFSLESTRIIVTAKLDHSFNLNNCYFVFSVVVARLDQSFKLNNCYFVLTNITSVL